MLVRESHPQENEVKDAAIDPFRISLENIAHAAEMGAASLQHTQVIGFRTPAVFFSWLRDELKLNHTAAEIEAIAALVEDANVVYKEELVRNVAVDREFVPRMPLVQRQNLIRGWQRAVDRSRGWEQVG